MSNTSRSVSLIETNTTACSPRCDVASTLTLDDAMAGQLAATFKALGNPVRLQIVDILSRFGGQVCVCDIEHHFSLSQPTISHHLKVLRQAGLIDSEQQGLWVYYFIAPGSMEPLRALLDNLQ